MKDNFSEINVIPLVDIMLVLITIVLVTANFMVKGIIPVNLPEANAENPSIKESLQIDMTKEGNLYLNGVQVSIEDLPEMLAFKDKNTPVLISADKQATIQPFVSAVEAIKDSGFTKVSIQTER
ncbi:biopolymer transporter ExbD [Geovibrio sp. ADMFC3]